MAELSAKEQLEAMINGTHVPESDETEEQTEELETESTETDEDTDLETETTEEDETTEENDDSTPETSETEEEAQEEDAHSETENSEENDSNETEPENTEEEVNYKEFYEKVALAKFTANGKEVEGFKNPEDLIRAQQMLHGYSDKMKVFKEYKKFLKPLEERGVTNDPDKFNLAMSLLDGDVEAIKKVLKDKNIDPMELDLEDVKYTPKNVLPTNTQILIEETYEQAENLGIGDKFSRVVSKDWDVPSLQELVNNSAVRNDLLQHLSDGTYDIVQNEIRRMELLDTTGRLDSMSSVDKYRMAVRKLQEDYAKQVPKKPAVPVETAAEKAEKARQAEEFKRLAAEKAKKEAEIAEQRKKAAAVSKKKAVKAPASEPKLEELKGDAFRNAFKNMLMS